MRFLPLLLATAVLGCSGTEIVQPIVPLHSPNADTTFLFVGNSHTEFNNLTGTFKILLERESSLGTVSTERLLCGWLEDYATNLTLEKSLIEKKYKFVVLQAQKISASHKFTYSDEAAIMIGKLAKASGARVLYFAEWPRQDVNESKYIYDIYAGISKQVGAETVPVGFAFDYAISKNPRLKLWAADGNHSSPLGAYLAACTFYYWILGDDAKPPIVPEGTRIDPATRDLIAEAAQSACKRYRTN